MRGILGHANSPQQRWSSAGWECEENYNLFEEAIK